MIRGSFCNRVTIAEEKIEKLSANSQSTARFKEDPMKNISLFVNRNYIPPLNTSFQAENLIAGFQESLASLKAYEIPKTTDELQAITFFMDFNAKIDSVQEIIDMRMSGGGLNQSKKQSHLEKVPQPAIYQSEIMDPGVSRIGEDNEQKIKEKMHMYGLSYEEARSLFYNK